MDTLMSDRRELEPPCSFTVDHEHRPVLYRPDGKALVRAAGFVPQGSMQSTGQFPQLNEKPQGKKSGSKKPTKKGRGC